MIADILDRIRNKALKDAEFRGRLLATQNHTDPISSFCRICREQGYELYEMELIAFGEESYAAMKRSTNGGGENSPMMDGQDDYYELLMLELAAVDGRKL